MGELVYLKQPTQWEIDFYEAATLLAQARVQFSQEFQVAKMEKGRTDEHARQIAIEQTGDRVTQLQAVYDIAKVRMETHAAETGVVEANS